MNNRLILISLLVPLLVGGLFVWYKKQSGMSPLVEPTVVESVSITTEEPIDISDWKTYRNEKYGYSMKYPSNWYVDTRFSEKDFSKRGSEEDPDFIGGDTLFSNYPGAYEFNLDNRPIDIREINLMVFKIDQNIAYDQFKYGYVEGNEERGFIEVDGKKAYRIERINTDHPVGIKVVSTLLKSGEYMFLLTCSYDPKVIQDRNDMLDVYEKVVESFRLSR